MNIKYCLRKELLKEYEGLTAQQLEYPLSNQYNDFQYENKIKESEFIDSLKFITEKQDEDRIKISAIYKNEKIGSVILELNINAYWYFEDDFSEEEYNNYFPNDQFVKIEHIEIYDNYYRGSGIAKKLMNLAINKSKQLGYSQIYLNASPMGFNNLKLNDLVQFYKKFGFKEILNQGNNVQMLLNI